MKTVWRMKPVEMLSTKTDLLYLFSVLYFIVSEDSEIESIEEID